MRPFLLQLIDRVSRHLDPALKARIDSVGVVNDAWNSFLTGLAKEEFLDLPDRGAIRRLLTALVARALRDEIRRHKRHKRSPYREQGSGQGRPEACPGPPTETPAAEVAAWLEQFEKIVRSVHPKAIDIVRLSLEGLSNNEIKDELDLGLRTVQVIRRHMKRAWDKAQSQEG